MVASQVSAAQANLAIRQAILANGIPVLQQVKSGTATYTQGSPTVVNILASPTGLIRRFYLVLKATVNCAATHTATPTTFGLPNVLSNVQFIDQNNRLRINTSGLHLHLRACEVKRRPFGGAMVASTGTSDPTGLGQNWPVQVGTGAVSGGTAKTFTWVFEIPVVQSNLDLTGCIYANQITANNQIQFTLNPSMFEYNGDTFNAAYSMDAALATSLPTLTNINWYLWQDYLDQIPSDPKTGMAIYPPIDSSYALGLTLISPGTMVAAVDNLYALPPFNMYQHMFLLWDNYGYSGAVGSDVNYIKVQIANSYVLKYFEPNFLSVLTRDIMGVDPPAMSSGAGSIYSLDFRHKPLYVNQLSQTNLIFNPATVESGAVMQHAQEYVWFAQKAS